MDKRLLTVLELVFEKFLSIHNISLPRFSQCISGALFDTISLGIRKWLLSFLLSVLVDCSYQFMNLLTLISSSRLMSSNFDRAFCSRLTSIPFLANFLTWLAGDKYFRGRLEDESVDFSLCNGELERTRFLMACRFW